MHSADSIFMIKAKDLVFLDPLHLRSEEEFLEQEFLFLGEDVLIARNIKELEKLGSIDKEKILYTDYLEDIKKAGKKKKANMVVLKLENLKLDSQALQILHDNNVSLAFFYWDLFCDEKSISKKFGALKKVSKLCKKYFVALKVYSGARKKEELRNLNDLVFILKSFGFSDKQITGFYKGDFI
jgi:RNase P/RNase MRP subunit p30